MPCASDPHRRGLEKGPRLCYRYQNGDELGAGLDDLAGDRRLAGTFGG